MANDKKIRKKNQKQSEEEPENDQELDNVGKEKLFWLELAKNVGIWVVAVIAAFIYYKYF